MDIVIGNISTINKDSPEGNAPPTAGAKRAAKERRKSGQDRRRDVREGIIVSLSTKNDRRVARDRRRSSF